MLTFGANSLIWCAVSRGCAANGWRALLSAIFSHLFDVIPTIIIIFGPRRRRFAVNSEVSEL